MAPFYFGGWGRVTGLQRMRGSSFARPALSVYGLLVLSLSLREGALTWRCKSSPELATAREAKRKGVRATNRLKEAWNSAIVDRRYEPTNRNRIQGAGAQGERAIDREALVAKAIWRKSGGCVEKVDAFTRGDLASRLKG